MENEQSSITNVDIYSTNFWSLNKAAIEEALINKLSDIKIDGSKDGYYYTVLNFEIWEKFPNTQSRLRALTAIIDSERHHLSNRVLDLLVRSLLNEIFSSATSYGLRIDFLNLLARSPEKNLSWLAYGNGRYNHELGYKTSNNEIINFVLLGKDAFKLIYDSTQKVNNNHSPIEIAAQHSNIDFLIQILKLKRFFIFTDPTKDLERSINSAFNIMLTSEEIDYSQKAELTEMLDYLGSFWITGLETRLYANLKRQIWIQSQTEENIKINIDMEYYGIDGNDNPKTCYDTFISYLPIFDSYTSNSVTAQTIQDAIPVGASIEFTEMQSLISPSNKL